MLIIKLNDRVRVLDATRDGEPADFIGLVGRVTAEVCDVANKCQTLWITPDDSLVATRVCCPPDKVERYFW